MGQRGSTSTRLLAAIAAMGALLYGVPLVSREAGGTGASFGDLVCAVWHTLAGQSPGVPCDALGIAVAGLLFATIMLVGRPSVRL